MERFAQWSGFFPDELFVDERLETFDCILCFYDCTKCAWVPDTRLGAIDVSVSFIIITTSWHRFLYTFLKELSKDVQKDRGSLHKHSDSK